MFINFSQLSDLSMFKKCCFRNDFNGKLLESCLKFKWQFQSIPFFLCKEIWRFEPSRILLGAFHQFKAICGPKSLQIAHESPLLLKVKSLLFDILFGRIFPMLCWWNLHFWIFNGTRHRPWVSLSSVFFTWSAGRLGRWTPRKMLIEHVCSQHLRDWGKLRIQVKTSNFPFHHLHIVGSGSPVEPREIRFRATKLVTTRHHESEW